MNRFQSFLFASVFTLSFTGVCFAAEEAKPSDYYVGVVCAAVPEIVENHLNLKKGVLVQGLAPEGPAEKANFKAGDIILAVDGKDVMKTHDIIDAIDADKELTFTVLQNGEKKELKVKPEKRPESFTHLKTPATGVFRTLQPGIIFDSKDSNEARELIKKFIKEMEAVGINAEEVLQHGHAPNVNHLEVTVHQGTEPGSQKIHVRQNNEIWEVEKIEQLPQEIQQKVKNILSATGHSLTLPHNWSELSDAAKQEYLKLSEQAKRGIATLPHNWDELTDAAKQEYLKLSDLAKREMATLPHNWNDLSDAAKERYHSLSEQAKAEYRKLSALAGKEYQAILENKDYDSLLGKAKDEYKHLLGQAGQEYNYLSEQAGKGYDALSEKSAQAWKAMQEKIHQEHEALEKEIQKAYQHAPELKEKFNQYRKSSMDYIESFWNSHSKEEGKK